MRMMGMLAVASAVVLSGCGGDDDEVEDLLRPPAAIYFHNQITDPGAADATSTTVDLVARGDVLFEQRPYSTDEQDGMFFKLNSDTEAVTFRVNNNSAPELVKDMSLSLAAGEKYTLVAMGQVSGSGDLVPTLKLYQQSVAGVAAGKVRIRLINALSGKDGSPMIVYDDENALADGFMYGASRPFKEAVPESDTKLTLTIIEYALNITHTASCAVKAGKSYDVILAHPAYDSGVVDIFCQQVHGS